ncbi:MAG: MlaD family protein [Gordonia amarae]
MFLVKLIDVFVGILEFIFKADKRAQGASAATLGTAGIITLLAILLVAVGVPRIIYYNSTDQYTAELSNASGLTTADPVLVAGVPAGRIEKISLAGDRVNVKFRLDNGQPLGDQTTAGVRLRTVLGKRYLEIIPAGSGPVGTGKNGAKNVIPLSRTTSPYNLDDLSSDAVNTSKEIDVDVLRTMMTTMTKLMPDSKATSDSLSGITAAASTITRSGTQLGQLLTVSQRLAAVTSQQSETMSDAFSSTQALVQMLSVRHLVLTRLTDNLRLILRQMAATFPNVPMAELTVNLTKITKTLADNAGQVNEILTQVPPSLRTITDASGNGNWADVVSPSAVIPDGLLCVLGVVKGCK